MKILISLFLLWGAVAAGQEGASRLVPNNDTAGNHTSAPEPHVHRYSDLRMIPVEVQEVDSNYDTLLYDTCMEVMNKLDAAPIWR